MAVIDHQAELSRAGANVHGWFSGLLFFARRYPLGAVGAIHEANAAANRKTTKITAPAAPSG